MSRARANDDKSQWLLLPSGVPVDHAADLGHPCYLNMRRIAGCHPVDLGRIPYLPLVTVAWSPSLGTMGTMAAAVSASPQTGSGSHSLAAAFRPGLGSRRRAGGAGVRRVAMPAVGPSRRPMADDLCMQISRAARVTGLISAGCSPRSIEEETTA
jgi:hypothetical protein